MAGVITPGASRLRLSHSTAICDHVIPVLLFQRMAHSAAVSRIRKQSVWHSPSRPLGDVPVVVPELRGSPV
jgi:hypothetical protein